MHMVECEAPSMGDKRVGHIWWMWGSINGTQTTVSCMEVEGVAIYMFAMGKLKSFIVSYSYVNKVLSISS